MPVRPLSVVAVAVLALLQPGCRGTAEQSGMTGVSLDAQGVFRQLEFPGVDAVQAYAVTEELFREAFPGGPIYTDAEHHSIELIRAFSARDKRVRMFAQVSPGTTGARLELLARLEELPEELPEGRDPWVVADPARDWKLEDHLFRAAWEELVVKPEAAALGEGRVDGPSAAQVPQS